MKRKKKYKAVN